jgi:hypothetical protein
MDDYDYRGRWGQNFHCEDVFTWARFGKAFVFNAFSLALSLHPKKLDEGRRAEDPFRGLRAGPARLSSQFFRRVPSTTPNSVPKTGGSTSALLFFSSHLISITIKI